MQGITDKNHIDIEKICEACSGDGVVDIPYASVPGSGIGMSNEEAMDKAGKIHHQDLCGNCDGRGILCPDCGKIDINGECPVCDQKICDPDDLNSPELEYDL